MMGGAAGIGMGGGVGPGNQMGMGGGMGGGMGYGTMHLDLMRRASGLGGNGRQI